MEFNKIINDIMMELGEHSDDYPKCIFMSNKLYMYLMTQYFLTPKYNCITTIYGVPIKSFESEDYEWWLSWDKYCYKDT